MLGPGVLANKVDQANGLLGGPWDAAGQIPPDAGEAVLNFLH